MDWVRWIVVVALSISTIDAFQCPEGSGCSSCHVIPNGVYEIDCATSTDAVFNIQIRPNQFIKISCHNSPNWTEFHLGTTYPIERVSALYFRMCNLPEANKLGSIARQLLAESIEELDFRSFDNLSSTLTRESLRGFTRVERLTLSSNSLSQLPEDLLEDLIDLRLLNLRENNLRQLPNNFLRAENLEAIELGNNKIESFASNTFDKLQRLRLLNIWNNKLVIILPNTFDKLESLETLDIHLNRLQTLPSEIFASLTKLKVLNLSQNNFTATSLPADLLRNNSNLENIAFFENKQNLTTLPAGFFANLKKLAVVKLKRNGLTWLPEDLFRGTINLSNLSLERNYLSTLPRKLFNDTSDLLTLDLSFNDLSSLPDDVFSPLGKLVKLELSKNHLTTISGKLFAGLSSLRELNLERNDLTTIHDRAFSFLQKLKVAKFSYNLLTLKSSVGAIADAFGPRSPFDYCRDLEELYLAHNNITDLFSDWNFATRLRILNLSYNRLQYLQAGDLQFLSEDLNVDLTYNNISNIVLQNVEVFAIGINYSRNVIIKVENNPLNCDCKIYDLLRYLEGRLHPNVQNMFHLKIDQLKCNAPAEYHDIAVSDLRSKTLKCEAFGADTDGDCPERCNCYLRPENKALLVDCAYRGLTEAPKKLPTPRNHHIELNLTGNRLTKMPTFDQPGYEKVTVLSLDHNNISSVSVNTLSQNLEVLKLNNNNLTKVKQDVIDFLKNSSSMNKLTLDANPWTCDCEARDFLNFIQAKRVTIVDLLKVTCHDKDVPISEMTPEELCPVEIGWIIGGCLGIAFLGIILGSLAALYYRYQREVKVWLYARQWCLWFVTEDELDKDKLYDAFISYSHQDEEFVVNNLVTNLESGPRPFKLCIHFRNWVAGEWIPKQIARSVEESRRTIVVLSPNFLESVWGRMEFRTAHSQALSEGRARVIVILYGEIGPTDDLDPELKAYLSMNTYVKWGDPWFWEKLRYALPHPPEFTKRNMRRKIFEATQPRIHIANDKSELINPPGIPPTPPAATTPPADVLKTFVDNDNTRNEINKSTIKDMNKINESAVPIVITNCESAKNNPKANIVQCTTV